MRQFAQRGVTLIELLVAISIGLILIMFAVPAYNTWTSDAEEQNAAASIADGLRFATAEAIKQNRNVEFEIDPAAGSGGWVVRVAGDATVLRDNRAGEGAYRATVTAAPAGRTLITFNSLSLVEGTNLDTTFPFNSLDVSVANSTRANAGAVLRVLVGNGRTGIKVCDSRYVYPANVKGCPP
jgi:type IV fimbrial biogenesis protein FimT